jgi:PilZ domain-containing protein
MARRSWLLACLLIRGRKLVLNLLWRDASPAKPPDQAKKESRVHGRFKIKCPIKLSWHDPAGKTFSVKARGVDMSTVGARVESPEPLVPGSFTYLQVPDLKLMGSALVRYCIKRGLGYRIGLEFRSPLTKTY